MTVYVVMELYNGQTSALYVLLTEQEAKNALEGYRGKGEVFYQTAFMPDGSYVLIKK
jgi:hypothetical protein